MKHAVEPPPKLQAASARVAGVTTLSFMCIAFAGLACSALDDPSVRDGAVRGWYLPLGLLLLALRAGARRDTRRALSLALFLLGVGALAARALAARSASPADGSDGVRAAVSDD